ncbi:MAG: ABC transporter permease subunit [Candidatus Taylorbacteria bacterium]|nr:ABC transporter permease subunit [Candidatus Taylorbacteria bacterium]
MGIFKINSELGRKKYFIPVIMFVLFAVAYLVTSHLRHKENSQDKIAPTFSSMAEATKIALFEPDRDGSYFLEVGSEDAVCSQEAVEGDTNTKFCFGGILFIDTWASGRRFIISLIVVSFGILLGLHMGILPYFEAIFYQFAVFFNKIPALVLLPIIFILFGLDELSKIALIVLGVLPAIALDAYLRVKEIYREQIVKGFTLGATDFEITYRIILPQIFPKVLNTIRLNFLPMALLLIAGESLAATEGLGYRIFVLRRYIAMETIIPYAVWISGLLFVADRLVTMWIRRFVWLDKE